jgi:hypothetical protein
MSTSNGHGERERLRGFIADLLTLADTAPPAQVLAEAQRGFALLEAATRFSATGFPPRFLFASPRDRADENRNEWSDPPPAWTPRPLSDLAAQVEEVPWVWNGLLARGFVTLLSGLPKAGKSTLVTHLLSALCGNEPFLRQDVAPAQVLVVSEEGGALWTRRRAALAGVEHVDIVCQPFVARPTVKAWVKFLQYLSDYIQEHGVALVVFDTISSFLPVTDENAAAEVLAALAPLRLLTKANAAVLLVAHTAKSDKTEGRATRGSNALVGFADVIAELRRFDPERRPDTRRVLTCYSRFDETPAELVLEYQSGSYTVAGTVGDAKAADRLGVVLDVLQSAEHPLTMPEVLAAWPTGDVLRPSPRTLERDLEDAVRRGLAVRVGRGVRGDPARYSSAQEFVSRQLHPYMTRNQFHPEATRR